MNFQLIRRAWGGSSDDPESYRSSRDTAAHTLRAEDSRLLGLPDERQPISGSALESYAPR